MEAHRSGRGRELRGAEAGGVAGDLVRGAVAGAAGVWIMDRVDWFMYHRVSAEARRRTEDARPGAIPAHVMAGMAPQAAGVALSSPKQNPAGLAARYGLGVFPGALYGALRGRVRRVGAGRGLLFGFGLFVVEDELANPLLGIAAPPGRHPWQAHARGLIAHLIYGVATDVALCNPLISMTRRMSAFSKCVTRTTMPCRYIQCRSTILTPSSDIAISRL